MADPPVVSVHNTGTAGNPEDDRITLHLIVANGQISLEIPAPGILSTKENGVGRTVQLLDEAIATIQKSVRSLEASKIHWVPAR